MSQKIPAQKWYVVCDSLCEDQGEEHSACWTLSRDPNKPGWKTDGGRDGYGLTYADAHELALAVNGFKTPGYTAS